MRSIGRTAGGPAFPERVRTADARGRRGLLGRAELSERQSGALWGKSGLPGPRAAEQVLSGEEGRPAPSEDGTLSQSPPLLWGLSRHQLWVKTTHPGFLLGCKPHVPFRLGIPGIEGSGWAASRAQTCRCPAPRLTHCLAGTCGLSLRLSAWGAPAEGGLVRKGKRGSAEPTGRATSLRATSERRTCPPWAVWPRRRCPATAWLEDTEAWTSASLWDSPGDSSQPPALTS